MPSILGIWLSLKMRGVLLHKSHFSFKYSVNYSYASCPSLKSSYGNCFFWTMRTYAFKMAVLSSTKNSLLHSCTILIFGLSSWPTLLFLDSCVSVISKELIFSLNFLDSWSYISYMSKWFYGLFRPKYNFYLLKNSFSFSFSFWFCVISIYSTN